MSAISLKSITGITSITTPAGVDNQLTLHNNNTTEAVKLDIAGNLHFHNHLNITGVSTASNFKTGTSNLHNTGLNVQDLDVDGHTNLDNTNIVGILTVTSTTQYGGYKLSNNSSVVGELVGLSGSNDTGALALWHGGSKYVQISAQGNSYLTGGSLGIGTISPAVMHHLYSASGGLYTRFESPQGQVNFGNSNGTGVIHVTSTSQPLRFLVNGNNERARIASDGKFGIGDFSSGSAPSQALHIKGSDTKIFLEHTGGYDLTIASNTGGGMCGINPSGGYLDLCSNNRDLVACLFGGSVGIGTLSPQKKLHVHVSSGGTPVLITGDIPAVVLNPSVANSSDNDRSHFGQATASNNFCNGVSSGDTVLRGTNSGKLIFGLGTSIKMLITNDGNLGLGDNAPPNFTGYRSLSIHGSTGGALVFGDDGTDEWETYGGDGVFKIYDRAATTTRLHLDGSYGRFGINTSSFSDTATALALRNGRSDNDHTILDIICNDNNTCRITFSEDSNSSKGSIRYYYTGDGNYMSFYTNGSASGNERLRIDSSGRVIIGTTSSSARLHVKGDDTANAFFETTRSTGAYLQLALGASGAGLGYIGASNQIVSGGAVANLAVRSEGELVFAAGGNSEVLRIDTSARLRTRGATNIGHGGMVYIQGYSDPTADETKSNLTVRGEGGNGFACGTYEATGNYASWIQAGYVLNFTGGSPAAIYPLVLQPNGAPVCIGNKSDASTNDAALLRIQTQTGSSYAYQKWGLSLEHFNSSNAREQKFTFINESSQGTQAEANSIFRQHAVPYQAGTTYQLFTDRIVYQHRPGYERYSWYKFNVHVTSSSRGGSARMGITWSSRHAGPGGYGEYSFAWTDEHHTSYAQVFCRKQHFLSIGGASHGPYNWTSNPAVTVYSSTGGGSQGGFYLRVEGHLDANSSTYDGGVTHHFDIVHNDNNTGGNNTYFEFIQHGSSGPSQASQVLSFN